MVGPQTDRRQDPEAPKKQGDRTPPVASALGTLLSPALFRSVNKSPPNPSPPPRWGGGHSFVVVAGPGLDHCVNSASSRVSLWASALYANPSNPPRQVRPPGRHPEPGQTDPPWTIARLGSPLPHRPSSQPDVCALAPRSQRVTPRGRDVGRTTAPMARPRKTARGYLSEERSESSEGLRESLAEAVGGALCLARGSCPHSAERLRLGILHADLGPMSRWNGISTSNCHGK